ncbi:DUF350 domain-containing protein [Ferdinandcohnia quinoae]|uniref:DUF350 domain-containing protein n=1 Tax=Fredinandcohnia quinoae TaxID=2918902 RepID=A0AAW5DZ46_9BACI|nr:DUF350 domain-containing protein [Fredinandcohnia sp. SECRCQ15]MCH1624290.1 DUF350 domain-containing protein [Fredinandcohnia sp. SECRCQ15]
MDLLLNYLAYIGLGIVLLLVGLWLFEVTTKNKEFKLIASGNKAAAYSLGGRLLGLGIVLYSAISNSVSLTDMLLWGGIGIITQILVFLLAELLTPKFSITESIDNNNESVGLFLLFLSVSIGFVVAGCLTY